MSDWVHAYFHPNLLGLPETTSLEAFGTLFLLILGELLASAALGRKVYSLRQTINNLAASLLAQVFFGTCLKALNMLPYRWVHAHYALLDWPAHQLWALNLIAFLYCDLAHYTMHRFLHEHNLSYAMHAVHHSSPDYNFSVGVRLSMTESAVDWVLYLPLALLCPPTIFLAHRTTSALTHTELIRKFWWPIEFVFVTPSHHRVHHSRNYGQKNYGGLLIVWDRLFGTFQEERTDRKAVYGLYDQAVPQGTYSPMWHQVHYFFSVARLAVSGKVSVRAALWTRTTGPGMFSGGKAPDGVNKLGAGPRVHIVAASQSAAVGCTDGGARRPAENSNHPWEARPLNGIDAYAVLCFLLIHVPCTLLFLKTAPSLSTAQILGGGAFSMWTTTSLAWLCGSQRQALANEVARLVVQAALAALLGRSGGLTATGNQAGCAACALSLAGAVLLAVHAVRRGYGGSGKKRA